MSEEKRDPLAPEIPEQVKIPETPETRVEEKLEKEAAKVVEFKKDVKFLWIYASVFCIVLVLLIEASSIIQKKRHIEVENLQNQAATAEQSDKQTKSLLKNIQEENERLKSENQTLKSEKEVLEAESETSSKLIASAEATLSEIQKLSSVQLLFEQNKFDEARQVFATVIEDKLPQTDKETYAYYQERLK